MAKYNICLVDGTMITVEAAADYTKSLPDKTIFFDDNWRTVCIVPDKEVKYILRTE